MKYTVSRLSLSIVFLALFGLMLGGCNNSNPASSSPESLQEKTMTVYHSPTCGCCKHYVNYLKENGLNVKAVEQSQAQLSLIKGEHGIPRRARSCHTAVIGDYTIEGHVPVEAIAKLVNDQPSLRGISIPRMPRNTPGMGDPVGKTFTVMSISHEGQIGDYSSVTY